MKITLLYTVVSAGVVSAFATGPHPVQAQTPARWTIAPVTAPSPPKAGAIAKVHIEAAIQPGWHIYSITQPSGGPIATRITLPPEQSFEIAGTIIPSPAPRVAFDDAFHMNVELHEKAVGFTVPVRYIGREKSAADSIRVNVRYQVCNASLCYPPQTAKLVAPVAVRTR